MLSNCLCFDFRNDFKLIKQQQTIKKELFKSSRNFIPEFFQELSFFVYVKINDNS